MSNKELIERLHESMRASDICNEAADALAAADKRIAELEAGFMHDITGAGLRCYVLNDAAANKAIHLEENLAIAERKLDVAREALNAMLTHMGMDEDEWNKVTFDQARMALAQIGGEDAR